MSLVFSLPVRLGLSLGAIVVATGATRAQGPTTALRVRDFLDSLGANSSVAVRGETLPQTINAVKYTGLSWIRGGYEGGVPTKDLIDLHNQTGVRFSYGLLSGGADIPRLLEGAHQLAAADALVAFEGPNEPNNWGITYQGQAGGGKAPSWLAVAKLQRDFYAAIKSDPVLRRYPVWSISENGAEVDDVGLQYLVIPNGAKCALPDGTRFADYANVHNYVYHPNSPNVEDNKTWNAADPTPDCKVDGLYGNYGTTWAHHFQGYSLATLKTLPRVTTETGTTIGGPVTEEIHALNLLSLYLDQFKRGWSYTAVYLLRDRSDESGNQQFGFYKTDYTPRKAALYLHNLTTILADQNPHKTSGRPGRLNYTVLNPPKTVHDMLLQKRDDTFYLVVWDEKVSGSDLVTVDLGGVYNSVSVYDPTIGTDPIQIPRNISSITLTLSNHPQILAVPSHSERANR